MLQPRTGRPQPPAPLDGTPLSLEAPGDRREHLARWLTAAENPYFARAAANRVWAALLGVGLVEPVDDMRLSNPAINPPLLEALAARLVADEYDIKKLIREILRSETYQRSSRALAESREDRRCFSHYYPRRLQAEVLHDAICRVTGVPSRFTQTENIDGSTNETDFYPAGTRAIALYDSAVVSRFLDTFGRNERAITCECERSNEPTIVQVLQVSNGSIINDKLASKTSIVEKQFVSGGDDAAVVESVYLTALFPPADRRRAQGVALDSEPHAGGRTATGD